MPLFASAPVFAQGPADAPELDPKDFIRFSITMLGAMSDAMGEGPFELAGYARKEAKIQVFDGKLCNGEGKTLTPGDYMYVISTTGDLYMIGYYGEFRPQTYGLRIKHSTILGLNAPVTGAGNVTIDADGRPQFNIGSGHFMPHPIALVQLASVLSKIGFDLANCGLFNAFGLPTGESRISEERIKTSILILESLRTADESKAKLPGFASTCKEDLDSESFECRILVRELRRVFEENISETLRARYLHWILDLSDSWSFSMLSTAWISGRLSSRLDTETTMKFLFSAIDRGTLGDEELKSKVARLWLREMMSIARAPSRIRNRYAMRFARWMSDRKHSTQRARFLELITADQQTALLALEKQSRSFKESLLRCTDWLL